MILFLVSYLVSWEVGCSGTNFMQSCVVRQRKENDWYDQRTRRASFWHNTEHNDTETLDNIPFKTDLVTCAQSEDIPQSPSLSAGGDPPLLMLAGVAKWSQWCRSWQWEGYWSLQEDYADVDEYYYVGSCTDSLEVHVPRSTLQTCQ